MENTRNDLQGDENETEYDRIIRYVDQGVLANIVDSPPEFARYVISQLAEKNLPLVWENLRRECNRQFSVTLYQQCHAYSKSIRNRAFDTLSQYLFQAAMILAHDHELAAEAAQHTLVDIFKRLNTFEDPYAFMGYCKKALSHEVFRLLRKAKRRLITELALEEPAHFGDESLSIGETIPDTAPLVDNAIAEGLVRSGVWQCLAACTSISIVTQHCLYMWFVLDMGYHEISERLKVSLNGLQVRVSRAKHQLRNDKAFTDCLGRIGANEWL